MSLQAVPMHKAKPRLLNIQLVALKLLEEVKMKPKTPAAPRQTNTPAGGLGDRLLNMMLGSSRKCSGSEQNRKQTDPCPLKRSDTLGLRIRSFLINLARGFVVRHHFAKDFLEANTHWIVDITRATQTNTQQTSKIKTQGSTGLS